MVELAAALASRAATMRAAMDLEPPQDVPTFATAAEGVLAGSALQPTSGQTAFQSLSLASAATVPSSVKRLRTQFRSPLYAVPSTLVGGAEYRRASFTDLGPYPISAYFRSTDRFMPDGTTHATNGGYWVLDAETPTPYHFGAIADGDQDTSPAFQDWGDFCGITRREGEIPYGNYRCDSRVVWEASFDAECAPNGLIRFTDAMSCGFCFDLQTNPHTPFNAKFPSAFSPAIDSTFSIPGYSAPNWDYDVLSRVGSAIEVVGGSRYNIEMQNAQGWRSAIRLVGGATGVMNANIECRVNTADFCERLFDLDSGPVGGGGLLGFNLYANTAWVKHVLYIDATNNYVGTGGTVTVGAIAYLNEEGACAVYTVGDNACDFKIEIEKTEAGKRADSPMGTPSDLVCSYVGGDGASNGVSDDGGEDSIGYLRGNGMTVIIGSPKGSHVAASPKIGGYPSGADGKVRVKDAGDNTIIIRGQEIGQGAAIALSPTEGEEDFNGGIGGALLAKRQLVSMTVPDMPNSTELVFYFYHQLLSVAKQTPISIIPVDGNLAASRLIVSASDKVFSEGKNRQGEVSVINLTGGLVSGATYYFWLAFG